MTLEARIAGIAFHVPDAVVTNADLGAERPEWDLDRIGAKVGITARRVAAPGETAADLGAVAARRLLDSGIVDARDVDVLLLCTQSPDYFLPTTACVLQDRLGLPTSCAALDFNQGCSGYVYGLWLARALVTSGSARNVLLVTAETYSKFIHPGDRSVRVLFGDAAAATLVTAGGRGARIDACVLGTDGSGAQNLIVPAGAARCPGSAASTQETCDEYGSVRTAGHLFMDGQELFAFTLRRVPEVVRTTLARSDATLDDVDWFVFHQANAFMNEHLRAKLKIPREKAPMYFAEYGNTVSSTIPIALCGVGHTFRPGQTVMLVGFGVGYSWGASMLRWGDVRLL